MGSIITLSIVQSALELGFIYSLVALALFISFSYLVRSLINAIPYYFPFLLNQSGSISFQSPDRFHYFAS